MAGKIPTGSDPETGHNDEIKVSPDSSAEQTVNAHPVCGIASLWEEFKEIWIWNEFIIQRRDLNSI